MTTTGNDFVRTFSVTGPLNVSVELGSGEISISAGAVTEAVVRLQPDPAGDPDALDLIARTRVDLRGNALRIDVPRAMGFQRHPDVTVTALVPTASTVVTRSGSADVRLEWDEEVSALHAQIEVVLSAPRQGRTPPGPALPPATWTKRSQRNLLRNLLHEGSIRRACQ